MIEFIFWLYCWLLVPAAVRSVNDWYRNCRHHNRAMRWYCRQGIGNDHAHAPAARFARRINRFGVACIEIIFSPAKHRISFFNMPAFDVKLLRKPLGGSY
jgi:hypothetical protein